MTNETAYNLVLEARKNLHGWCEECKNKYLFDFVLQIKPNLIVEVGVYRGRSLASFSAASLIHNCTVIGVDAYDISYFLNETWSDQNDLDYSKNQLINEFNRLGLPFLLIQKPSKFAVEEDIFKHNKIDILHIDGCHEELNAVLDVIIWLPKLKTGGFLILDDANFEKLNLAQEIVLKKCEHIEYIENGKTRIFKKIHD